MAQGLEESEMPTTKQLVNQIAWLVDQQMRALEGKLTSKEAVEYGERKRRIDELLEQLSRDGSRLN